MKTIAILSFALLFVALGVLLDLVSAPTYGLIFLSILTCDLLAIMLLIRLHKQKTIVRVVCVAFGLVAVYTMGDMLLRVTIGVRVLDNFRLP